MRTIYDIIKTEENAYMLPVPVIDGYEWGMKKHIQLTTLYKNSQYESGKTDDKPFKNIIRPILNLQYRAEGFDVKDIELFVNSPKSYFKSFLVKKFHEKWARENEIDTFIDELVESYVDFGGALVKKVSGARPEVVPLQSLAFCDQTDLLSGTLGLKHFYAPDQLKEMEKRGWENIDTVIALAEEKKVSDSTQSKEARTTSKYVEVYEVHGMFPKAFLNDPDEVDENEKQEYTRQMHIVTFYTDKDGQKQGITLFKGQSDQIFKLILRDKIYGRALGFGGAEELFEPQVWVNYDVIRMKGMLDEAAKVIYKTTDPQFSTRNKTRDLDNGEILVLEEGKDIGQIDNVPRSLALFEKSVADWENHAQKVGAANDAIMGEQPTSGTPFKLQELVTAEAHSLHEYRKGKLAVFVDEIYRDWIIPHIVREIARGQEFLAELTLEELQNVADSLVTCKANELIRERIFNLEMIEEPEVEEFKRRTREQFMKGGSKRFLKLLKDELEDAPVDVFTNIVGKQKDLAGKTDKLVNIFRQIVTNPAVLDDPRMAKLFNEILEASGLSPIDFGTVYARPAPQEPIPSPMNQDIPLQALTQ